MKTTIIKSCVNKSLFLQKTLEKKHMPEQTVFVRKERQGFGGGFKILEEYRNKKLARKSATRKTDDEDEVDNKDQN